jgi:hypothetical protein
MRKSQREFVEAVAREKGLTVVSPEALTVQEGGGAGAHSRAPRLLIS